MKNIVFFFLLQVFTFSFGYSQQTKVNEKNIQKHIQYLASDNLAGRYPGTKYEKDAAKYILLQLQSVGCKPLCNNGFQDFPVELVSRNQKFEARNVVVWLKGSKNPDEFIVIGAHYDHLGMGGTRSGSRQPDTVAVHNGADDNASGVAALLECARVLSKEKHERSILFVAFSAEEEGLLGSAYFVNNLPVKKENIKAMVNFDMVGRLDSILSIEGTGTALQFDSLITVTQRNELFKIQRSPGGFGPSDHSSFYAEKIPCLFFHTSIHEQYHTPFDDWQLINTKGETEVVDFAIKLIFKLTNKSQELTYFSTGSQIDMSRNKMKVTLGIMPDHASGGGLRISSVTEGKPAAHAGLKKGDVIVGIQGEKITGIETYMQEMSKYEKGQIIIIDVLRNNEKMIFTINL